MGRRSGLAQTRRAPGVPCAPEGRVRVREVTRADVALHRSLPDLLMTLREQTELGVGFVSLTKALDLTIPTGRAKADMAAVFAEFEREVLRERVRAGIA